MEVERNDNNLAELIDTKLQLNFEINKDERYWEQRTRNTNGRKTGELQEMTKITRSCFQELFEASEKGHYEHLLTGIERCISEEDNRRLITQYTKEEIWEALTSMGATKAPGEYGFPAIFFQKCWHIIRDKVSIFCLQHLNGGMEVSPINTSHIVLIPKKSKSNQSLSFPSN
ncbi:reverse transcriptase [Gossypium australe]|uniref:Reverse transcriptase n=1 Tax=Gossypium australe TaxID=47621 RepID=A0A5B6X3N0_9ROSI|nr:reverse transcriptase [Gossypium australe]